MDGFFDFNGKVAIVTGSSSGIGAAAAKLFAKQGANVTLIGRNEKRLLEVAEICTQAHGKKPLCLLLDLTKENSCEEIVRKTIECFGKIDILVNSAGKIALTSLYDETMENFDELVALNLRMPVKMSQLCVPHLKKTKGVIVNIFGPPAKPRPGLLAVIMIREALQSFTTAGAVELASVGVRMNAVRPGITRTNLIKNLNIPDDLVDATYDRLARAMPNRSIIEPEEVARMILFAASETCPNMNASSLVLDSATSYL